MPRPPGLRVPCALRLAALALAGLLTAAAAPAQNDNAERAQRRLQQQLQALQQQLQSEQSARQQAEGQRSEAETRLRTVERNLARTRAALRESEIARKALTAELAAARETITTRERELAQLREESTAALAGKDRELAQRNTAHGAVQRELRSRVDEQTRLVAECTARNERLVLIGGELLRLYRDKGVIDVVRKREPVLGLGEVQLFEAAQTYRDRINAERQPARPRAGGDATADR
jgi:chromosome segregation ATPase